MAGKGAAPALIQQFYPGEEGGTALASALLGRTEFSGRLPITAVNSVRLAPVPDTAAFLPTRAHTPLPRARCTVPLRLWAHVVLCALFWAACVAHVVQLQQHQQQPQNLSVSVEVACEAALRVAYNRKKKLAGLRSTTKHPRRILHARDREEGEASMPLHELRAFQRVKLMCGAQSTTVRLTIAISDLALMDTAGQVAPLAGHTHSLVAPHRGLRRGYFAATAPPGSAAHGAPLPSLRATFELMSSTNFRT